MLCSPPSQGMFEALTNAAVAYAHLVLKAGFLPRSCQLTFLISALLNTHDFLLQIGWFYFVSVKSFEESLLCCRRNLVRGVLHFYYLGKSNFVYLWKDRRPWSANEVDSLFPVVHGAGVPSGSGGNIGAAPPEGTAVFCHQGWLG